MELEVNKVEQPVTTTTELKKPSPEEVAEVKLEFDNANALFATTKWEVGKREDAEKYIDFLLNYLNKFVYWSKNGWMGVIKFDEELREIKSKLVDDKFTLSYQAIEFGLYALSNPAGIGLDAAKEIKEKSELYIELFEIFSQLVDDTRKELKRIEQLQQKWAVYEQGYYYEIEPADDEMNGLVDNSGMAVVDGKQIE